MIPSRHNSQIIRRIIAWIVVFMVNDLCRLKLSVKDGGCDKPVFTLPFTVFGFNNPVFFVPMVFGAFTVCFSLPEKGIAMPLDPEQVLVFDAHKQRLTCA
jgi:hypothetical protein